MDESILPSYLYQSSPLPDDPSYDSAGAAYLQPNPIPTVHTYLWDGPYRQFNHEFTPETDDGLPNHLNRMPIGVIHAHLLLQILLEVGFQPGQLVLLHMVPPSPYDNMADAPSTSRQEHMEDPPMPDQLVYPSLYPPDGADVQPPISLSPHTPQSDYDPRELIDSNSPAYNRADTPAYSYQATPSSAVTPIAFPITPLTRHPSPYSELPESSTMASSRYLRPTYSPSSDSKLATSILTSPRLGSSSEPVTNSGPAATSGSRHPKPKLEWDRMWPRIVELYKGNKLQQVRKLMKDSPDEFDATPAQYKKQFKKRDVRKNVKRREKNVRNTQAKT